MDPWTSVLSKSAQRTLNVLEGQGYRFIWHDRGRDVHSFTPLADGTAWLTIQRTEDGRVLSFTGPIECPVPEETLDRVGSLLVLQAGGILQIPAL